jgi:hypothetical protein
MASARTSLAAWGISSPFAPDPVAQMPKTQVRTTINEVNRLILLYLPVEIFEVKQ